jgi:hypothetical protein
MFRATAWVMKKVDLLRSAYLSWSAGDSRWIVKIGGNDFDAPGRFLLQLAPARRELVRISTDDNDCSAVFRQVGGRGAANAAGAADDHAHAVGHARSPVAVASRAAGLRAAAASDGQLAIFGTLAMRRWQNSLKETAHTNWRVEGHKALAWREICPSK